jgi:uncharacterized protein
LVAIRRLRRFAGCVCVLSALASAAAVAADFEIPPRPKTEVVDVAGAMNDSARLALEDELESFESQTGHHVVAYIGQTTGSVPLERWTARTAQTWKVGEKGKDDGAVLFLFMKDRKVRIEVGYGLESSLTDAAASRIIADTIVPAMKRGDADDAVTDGASAMLTAIDPSFQTLPTTSDDSNGADESTLDKVMAIVDRVLSLWQFVICGLIGIVLVMHVYTAKKYNDLIRSEGREGAERDIKASWLNPFAGAGKGSVKHRLTGYGALSVGGGSSFSGGESGGEAFGGGSFGGGFGGGGASGSW